MSVLIAEDLEAAIVRDPDDLSSYAVYGDWLAERGDPRGELIATQLAADATNNAEMRRAALRVFAKHRDTFVGELGSMIAADALTWRAGFIYRAELAQEKLLVMDGALVAASLADVVGVLLAHPSAKFLVDLVVRTADRHYWTGPSSSQRTIIDRIAAARPRVLRRLQLGDAAYGRAMIGSLDHVWPALASLHELVLEGELSLGRVEAPELRVFAIRPASMRRRVGHQILEAKWPKLRSLRITFDSYPDHVQREINAIPQRTDMPDLVEIALVGYRSAGPFLEQLAVSPILPRLERLDISHSGLDDSWLRHILRDASRFSHLARLDVSSTKISRKAFARLLHLVPNAVGENLTR